MDQQQYVFAHLSETTLQQIRSLEQKLSEENGKDVILIAYENKGETFASK